MRKKALTEAQWCTSNDPEPMLEYLCAKPASRTLDRKLRLFACACVRRVWGSLKDPRVRAAVIEAERYARGQSTLRVLDRACSAAYDASDEYTAAMGQMDSTQVTLAVLDISAHIQAAIIAANRDIRNGAIVAARFIAGTVFGKSSPVHPDTEAELASQAALLRDIVGNPFDQASGDRSKSSRRRRT